MKSELVQQLSKLEGFEQPNINLEQYVTPPQLAAEIVQTAFMQGDIEGKEVVDLGAGTGMLSVAAALMGGAVTAVEVDPDALKLAKQNAEKAGVEIEMLQSDVDAVKGEFDTVIMNPPFSVHSEDEFNFFNKAFELGERVYSLAPGNSRERIKELAQQSQHEVLSFQPFKIDLEPSYGFHTQEARETAVDLVITEKR